MKIAVLTSGGVDSSVALARLAEEGGHELRAYYLKIWLEDELAFLGSCPWEEDLEYLREITRDFGVPLEIVSLQREYYERVVSASVTELEAGRTPSPDVLCNKLIKFGVFVDRIDASVDFVASGHYARVEHGHETSRLFRGVDEVKDQTYFLSLLRQEQLRRCLFPVGHLTKAKVRTEARRLALPNRNRPDSQGICFLGRVPYDAFVEHHLGQKPGLIRDVDSGAELGCHRGFWFHTIGQRKGLGLSGGPWFVVAKDHATNELLVAHRDTLERYSRDRFHVRAPHWIVGPPATDRLQLRVRHAPERVGCTVSVLESGELEVRMDRAETGIAPGQFAVLYDGEECLGGGAISVD